MLFVPLPLLKPGMILADGVPSYNIYIPLMTAGQVLTEKGIQSLVERGIQGAYIDSPVANTIRPQEFFTDEKRKCLLNGIKMEYERVRFSGGQPNNNLFEDMASEVVFAALRQEHLLYNVITIRNYDDYTYSHSLYVGGLACLIGAHMKLSHRDLIALATAGLLHDIGKLDISLSIINKPAKLTDEEFAIMQEHPSLGARRLIKNESYHKDVIGGVESHHEHFNGTGYPRHLSGQDIPLFGRILSIADVYDALSSARSYRSAWEPSHIIDYITSLSGHQFDPEILPAFLHSVAAYPVGTLVRLSNDWAGIVTKNYPDFILRPCIRLLKPPEEAGREIDLAHSMFHVTIVGMADESDDFQLP